jgi:hypothetical protein
MIPDLFYHVKEIQPSRQPKIYFNKPVPLTCNINFCRDTSEKSIDIVTHRNSQMHYYHFSCKDLLTHLMLNVLVAIPPMLLVNMMVGDLRVLQKDICSCNRCIWEVHHWNFLQECCVPTCCMQLGVFILWHRHTTPSLLTKSPLHCDFFIWSAMKERQLCLSCSFISDVYDLAVPFPYPRLGI